MKTLYLFLVPMTAVFVGMKATGVIAWSWWLIWLPLYAIPAFIAFLWIACVAVVALLNGPGEVVKICTNAFQDGMNGK